MNTLWDLSIVLLDGRNMFDPEPVRAMGFNYAGVGRP